MGREREEREGGKERFIYIYIIYIYGERDTYTFREKGGREGRREEFG